MLFRKNNTAVEISNSQKCKLEASLHMFDGQICLSKQQSSDGNNFK